MTPTLRLVGLAAALLGVAMAVVAAGAPGWAWVLVLVLMLAGAAVDAVRVGWRAMPTVEARGPTSVLMGEVARWEVRVRGLVARGADVLFDVSPLFVPIVPQRLSTATHAVVNLEVALRPRRRGRGRLEALYARWPSPWGLWTRQARWALGHELSVVPSTRRVRELALRLSQHSQAAAGMKVERFLGDGTAFEALREYVPGLDPRAVDWKATARHRKLLCQEFRAERDHNVVLVVDAGQLMAEPLDGMPRLDHAIHASLLLGWACLRTGDRVGLAAIADELKALQPPRAGLEQFARLQHGSAAIAYEPVETNYTLALTQLAARIKRRSLVVVFSQFIDTTTAELMIDNLGRMARQHRMLFATLRDEALEQLAAAPPANALAVAQAVVAAELLREKQRVLEKLRKLGIRCVDAAPREFSTALLNQYLEIKRRELV